MKKTLLAIGFTFVTATSMAATTATLVLKGTVPSVLSISLVAETLATNLPLSVTQTASKVATVTEASNSATGYKVTLSSINSGKLIRSNGTEQFPYTLTYGSQGGINLSSQFVISNPQAGAVNRTQDVKISYQGVASEQMVAGDYVDTVTFTIAAN
jgi:hypothetical protein